VDKKKRSLGRDAFTPAGDKASSQAIRKMLDKTPAKATPEARQVEVTVTLTPSNIKHLDALIGELERTGKGRFSRSELIRVAITLLSAGDF
jgi:Arc/MetJ-type ribon-helix-helix transcriptional regulator